ncbi:MAG: SusC/RagA family TonB-linked outer membrane protein [Labilibaculum sp.]|nr:SusC/RagA family TonB-linked outer membrane protein [Labilibaculum sp.]MBI9057071.1 SusC/RagA family TonB-linked outer membrane protein [Labilibaculum sp.]
MKKMIGLFVLLIFMGTQIVNAQSKQISGTVTSAEDGLGIPGVSVIIKGTTIGASTDIDGNYSLQADASDVLMYSFVGMITQEVTVGNKSVINVVMETESIGVDEVIVTGFGIKRQKRSVTYQTEKVDSEELMAGQQTAVAAALTGKVAGVQINIQNNGVKSESQILLRGLRSISANNEALIVIDGSIASTGAFDDLNPNDVESVNVLKGASAAALYGSRAANGAIIVVTKKGKKSSKFTVGIQNSTTFESVAYMPDFQTEYGTGWDGVYNNIENTNWGPRFDGQDRQIGPVFRDGTFQAVPYAPVKDNLKDFFNTGTTLQNTVYMNGGDDTGSFYLSVGHQDTKGIVPDDSYEKYTVRVNANKKIGKLDIGLNSSFMSDDKDVVGSNIGDQDRAFYWFLLNTPANIPLDTYKDWDNPLSYGHADRYFNAFYQNPYWAIGTNRDRDRTKRVNANLRASYDITDKVNFTVRAGVNSTFGDGKDWRAAQTYDSFTQPYHSAVGSYVTDSEFQSTSYTLDMLLRGEFDLTEDINLKAIVGSATYATRYRSSYLTANNLSIPDFYDVSNGTGELQGGVSESRKRTFGVFADLTFGYKNWAFLTLTGRQDVTSTLAKDDRSYFYPAAGLSIVLTEAIPSLADNSFLSTAKVTLSNSTVYNDLGAYQINESFYQAGGFPYGTVNGFRVANTAVAESIKKEKLNSTEIGMNMSFLQGRINLDAAYFFTKTTDLITNTTPSIASGAYGFLTNIGELKSTGVEVSLGGRVIQAGDFSWNMNVNFSKADTEVVEIVGDLKEVAIESYTGGFGTYAVVGETFPMLKAVAYTRDPQGRIVVDAVSGDPIVGEIENMGRTTPEYILGLNTSVSYKGLTLSATMDYRANYVYYSQGSDLMEFTGRSMESVQANRQDFVWPNSSIEVSPGVYEANTNTQITGGEMSFWKDHYNQIKENYVKDATAFKIRELALNYTFPKSLLNKTNFVNKVTVGFVARNLWTSLPKQKYRFSDPEFRNTRSTDAANGIGIGGYLTSPPTRSFGFNVNVEF